MSDNSVGKIETKGTIASTVPHIVDEEKKSNQQDTGINPLNANLKELFIFKGFQNSQSGQLDLGSKKKNVSRWQSLEAKKDISVLNKLDMDYEPISLLSTSQYGETYLIKKIKEEDKKKDEDKEDEYHILKILDKSKFLKKERAFVMRQVRAMMHVDQPTISGYIDFKMSTDFFYFLSKVRLKVGQ